MERSRGMHTENHWLQKLQLRASLLAHLTDIAVSVAWSVAVACIQDLINGGDDFARECLEQA